MKPSSDLLLATAARGCLAALATACAVALVGLGFCCFVATTAAIAQRGLAARPSRTVAPIAGPAVDIKAAQRSWGAIRARYRLKHLLVPA